MTAVDAPTSKQHVRESVSALASTAKLSPFSRLRLSGDSGRCRLTTSLSASSSGISTLRAPRASIVAASR